MAFPFLEVISGVGRGDVKSLRILFSVQKEIKIPALGIFFKKISYCKTRTQVSGRLKSLCATHLSQQDFVHSKGPHSMFLTNYFYIVL